MSVDLPSRLRPYITTNEDFSLASEKPDTSSCSGRGWKPCPPLSCCGASLCWVNGGMTTYLFVVLCPGRFGGIVKNIPVSYTHLSSPKGCGLYSAIPNAWLKSPLAGVLLHTASCVLVMLLLTCRSFSVRVWHVCSLVGWLCFRYSDVIIRIFG